jgi:hypothetical protein
VCSVVPRVTGENPPGGPPFQGEAGSLSKGERRPVKGGLPPCQRESIALSKGDCRPVKGRAPPCQRGSVSPGKGRVTPFPKGEHRSRQGESDSLSKGRASLSARGERRPRQGESDSLSKGRPAPFSRTAPAAHNAPVRRSPSHAAPGGYLRVFWRLPRRHEAGSGERGKVS